MKTKIAKVSQPYYDDLPNILSFFCLFQIGFTRDVVVLTISSSLDRLGTQSFISASISAWSGSGHDKL